MVRWNITIPKETDQTVRAFLMRKGGKKADLSRFVDEAVRCHVFDLTVRHIKDRNAEYDQREIIELVNCEADAVRVGRRS